MHLNVVLVRKIFNEGILKPHKGDPRMIGMMVLVASSPLSDAVLPSSAPRLAGRIPLKALVTGMLLQGCRHCRDSCEGNI
jgi:hypothetical protein